MGAPTTSPCGASPVCITIYIAGILSLLVASLGLAGPETRPPLADVVSVAVRGGLSSAEATEGGLVFEVGIESPDTGCEQYADWWEVVDADGRMIYRRVLRHSHVDEQPFVRSGGPVDLDPDRTVWVRAHMHPTGYGGRAMRGSVRSGFAAAAAEPGFAAELANRPPLPDGCAF